MGGEAITVEVPMFGAIELEPDAACVMDGGTHGCVGHTLSVGPDRVARWERRLDSMGDPDDCAGEGSLGLDDADWMEWSRLVDGAWEAAGRPPKGAPAEPCMEVPRYVWAVAMRRGDDVRVLDGPPFGDPWADPDGEIGELIAWMRERVALWCEAARRA